MQRRGAGDDVRNREREAIEEGRRPGGKESDDRATGGAGGAARQTLGLSGEDRGYGLRRIADLQATPVAVRFLSIEALLEDLGKPPWTESLG